METILKAAVLYFAVVFAAGFALGVIRTLYVVPRLGTRTAELLETPVMLLVTVVASRWTIVLLRLPPSLSARLTMGCIAFALLLVAEFALVRLVRGISVKEYLATRDRVTGTVYYVMLVIFVLMPLLVARK